ncbi:cytochrome c biogenesis protein CcdA [Bacillus pakistanensis]|uniref:Cytochrome c biogenesis protein CcdA n=1 Tax=Rossellomorea pakistanensis TaxID=992288 RepID=A0ABS2NHU8_9BACI|nr:sulfite exporter TauE/SafE family protein [Bacillus pakistanensis]MBM7587399.1 cytochrome c biogenesis protein CcdA [Bacillus pakistanensis]
MYDIFSQLSTWLMEPFFNLLYGLESLPVFYALILGIVGALAPCQFTGNISAMLLYGNQSIQKRISWQNAISFILGKIVAFSLLGLLVWVLGREVQQELTYYFPWLRKVIGPVLVIVGVFMLGLIRISGSINIITVPGSLVGNGLLGSFLLGLSFSLAFCPTMFVLFFVSLMPVAFSTSIGFIIPTIFAIGTALPLIIVLLIIWYLGFSGVLIKRGRKIGNIVQRTTGVLMIIMGILDTITYWSL